MTTRTTIDGQLPGWTGHITKYVAVTKSNATIYDPPLRMLYSSAGGDVTIVLADDDETDSAKYITRTLVAGQELTFYAIRQVRSTGTTALGLEGGR